MWNKYLAKNISAHSFCQLLFLSISWVIDYVASHRHFSYVMECPLLEDFKWDSKTAGTLDLASVWEDELNDPMDFFADGFLSFFVCPGFSKLRYLIFLQKAVLCYI